MAKFSLRQNDTLPKIEAILKDADDNAIDLTGASVRFQMKSTDDPNTVKVDQAATLVGLPTTGQVEYEWAVADTDAWGDFKIEWEITFGDNSILTVPNATYDTVTIQPELA